MRKKILLIFSIIMLLASGRCLSEDVELFGKVKFNWGMSSSEIKKTYPDVVIQDAKVLKEKIYPFKLIYLTHAKFINSMMWLQFYFNKNDQLSSIRLSTLADDHSDKTTEFKQIEDYFVEKYGNPKSKREDHMAITRIWDINNTSITISLATFPEVQIRNAVISIAFDYLLLIYPEDKQEQR